MRLYLIRHATAFDPDPLRWPDDAARPITPEGAAKFYMAAEGLRHVAPNVDVVLSSRLQRGWQTAAILNPACGWPEPSLTGTLAPDAPPRVVLAEVRALRVAGDVGLVGHEPQLSRILGMLVAGQGASVGLQFTPGAVACLEVRTDFGSSSPSFVPGSASLRWMMPQGILRRVRRKRRLEEPLVTEELVTAG